MNKPPSPWQIPLGGFLFFFGLPVFLWFASRPRPSVEEATEAMRQTAFLHDAGTVVGLLMIFGGLLSLLIGFSRKWNNTGED